MAALKKGSSSENKPITLTVTASFAATGKFDKVDLTPSLGAEFEKCFRAEANKWTVTPKGVRQFKAQLALTSS
jgi:hypothetical protein